MKRLPWQSIRAARPWGKFSRPSPWPGLSHTISHHLNQCLSFGLMLCLSTALALVLAARPVQAAEAAPEWKVDPDHSSVNFSIDHIYAKILGRFDRFTGTVLFDPQNLAGSSLSFSIETASVNTFVDKRNEHLRTADFFDVGRYPAITFVSKRIEEVPGRGYVVTGILTIKGLGREMQYPLISMGSKPNPLVKDTVVAGFESKFPINLVEWRLADPKWSALGVMGQTAEVAVYLEVLRPQ